MVAMECRSAKMHFIALVLLSFVFTYHLAHENKKTDVCMACWKYKIFTCINWVKIGLREISVFNELFYVGPRTNT